MAKKNKRTNHIFRFILIFILAFIILPIGIGVLLYQTNEDFKEQANKYMSKGPGIIGDYFNGYPTEEERNEKIVYIARHYASLDEASAADKLYIIKEKDENLYFDVINKMQQLPSKGLDFKEVVKLVRNIELRKNTLVSTFNEVKKETISSFQKEVDSFEKTDLSLAIDKVELEYIDEEVHDIRTGEREELLAIFTQMNEKRAAEILFYMDPVEIRKTILNLLPIKKSEAIKQELRALATEEMEFLNIAKLYETKNSDEAFLDIGNTEKYSLDELSKLYYFLDIEKGAEILVQSEDNAFIEGLLKQLTDFETLKNGQAKKVLSLSDKLTEKKNYMKKVENLSVIYEKIDNRELVKLLEKLLVTNSRLATDVLRNMKRTKVAEVLKMMEPRKAIEFSNRLAN